MDATPVYGFAFPEDTDAPDGPAQLEELALDVEAKLVAVDAAAALLPRGARARISVGTSADIGAVETITANGTFTAAANRCYRVSLTTPAIDNQGAGVQSPIVTLRYVVGAGPVTNAGTLIAKATVTSGASTTGSTVVGNSAGTVTLIGHINNVAAGSVNVGVGLTRLGTTDLRFLVAGTIGPDFTPYILIEDIGPNL